MMSALFTALFSAPRTRPATHMKSLSVCSVKDPNPGIKPRTPALQADSLPSEPLGKPSLFLATV